MEYTLEQLKAMAYDRITIINNSQNELNYINEMITQKIKQNQTEIPSEVLPVTEE